MVNFLGMDPDEIQRIGGQLQGQSDQLQGIISAVDNLVHHAEGAWKGQDAMQFVESWRSQYKGPMTQAVHALADLGKSAMQNAEQQRNVSGH